jgi:hypothetical protein
MLTRAFILSYRGSDALNYTFNVNAAGETLLSEVVTAGANPESIALVMSVANIKWLYLVSDQDIVLKTNDANAPANVFTLKANVPFVWTAGGPALRDTAGTAVATDITSLKAINAGEVDANLEGRIGYDPTP